MRAASPIRPRCSRSSRILQSCSLSGSTSRRTWSTGIDRPRGSLGDCVMPALAGIQLTPLPGAVPAWRGEVDARAWRAGCEAARQAGGRLAALWASDERDRGQGFAVRALLVLYDGLVCFELPMPADQPTYPDVADLFPGAARMQRSAFDLMGVRATC